MSTIVKTPTQEALERRQAADATLQDLEQKAGVLSTDIEGTRLELKNLQSEQSGQRYAAAHGDATAVDPSLRKRIGELDAVLEEKSEMLAHLTNSRKAASQALEEATALHRRAIGDEKEAEYVRRMAELNVVGRQYEAAWAAALAAFKEASSYHYVNPALETAKKEILNHGLTFKESPYEQIRLPEVSKPRYL
jgi:hypothetical protein